MGDPDFYLGSKLKMMEMANGTKCWAASPSKYVQEAVSNVESYVKKLDDQQWRLPNQAPNSFVMGCEPELDTTPELGPDLAAYYLSQIGVLRWIVEIGRIDITTEVSMLSSHVAMPREGHLEALLHVFAHISRSTTVGWPSIQLILPLMSESSRRMTGLSNTMGLRSQSLRMLLKLWVRRWT